MVLIPVLMILIAAWLLWAWTVSEHFDIAWLRKWCAILFTVTAVLISAGAGVFITRSMIVTQHRSQVIRFAEAIDQQLSRGNVDQVLRSVRTVYEVPDEYSDSSRDPLQRMLTITDSLQKSEKQSPADSLPKPQKVAARAER